MTTGIPVPTGADTLVVTFEPTVDEQVAASRAAQRWMNPWLSRAPFWVGALLALQMGLVWAMDGLNAVFARFLPSAVLLGGVVCLAFWWLPRREVRRMRRDGAAFGLSVAAELSPAGYRVRFRNGESTVGWDAMDDALESGESYLFLYQKRCAFYIPRRALSGPEDARLRVLVKRWMGERSRIPAP